jgi:crotonobetainyl-CoA:carnitine CoA-transferase CaiB-like acyl-CoA transferase
MDRDRAANPLYNVYKDREGRSFFLIMPSSQRHWPDFCRAISRIAKLANSVGGGGGSSGDGGDGSGGGVLDGALDEDPRFLTAALRTAHKMELLAVLEGQFLQRDWKTDLEPIFEEVLRFPMAVLLAPPPSPRARHRCHIIDGTWDARLVVIAHSSSVLL